VATWTWPIWVDVCWKPCSSCWSLHPFEKNFLSALIHSPYLVRSFDLSLKKKKGFRFQNESRCPHVCLFPCHFRIHQTSSFIIILSPKKILKKKRYMPEFRNRLFCRRRQKKPTVQIAGRSVLVFREHALNVYRVSSQHLLCTSTYGILAEPRKRSQSTIMLQERKTTPSGTHPAHVWMVDSGALSSQHCLPLLNRPGCL
jgi:hypothetical protein